MPWRNYVTETWGLLDIIKDIGYVIWKEKNRKTA